MTVFLRHLVFSMLAAATAASMAQDSFPSLAARPVAVCDAAPDCERLGAIRVLGMLELPPRTLNRLRFAELSGLAWDEDDGVLYALGDQGTLFGLKPVFRSGRLVDVVLVQATQLTDPLTHKPVRWLRSDAEGLDIARGRNHSPGDAELIVSFEREPRITRYRPDGRFLANEPLPEALRTVKRYQGGNKMLEAACLHPREGLLTAPEEPLDAESSVARLYRLDGSTWRFPANKGAIVALECLPDGDVLVLERGFQVIGLRTLITLRRLRLPAGTPPGTLLAAETVAALDSDRGLQIDNFEGLAHHQGNRFFMVSDNNDVFLQRTLLLYFELLTDRPGAR